MPKKQTAREMRKELVKVTVLPQKTESKESGSVSKDTLVAFAALLRQKLKVNEILDESKHREGNPNPNYRPPMGGKPTCS